MKQLTLLLVLLLTSATAGAQITFDEGGSLAAVLERAKKENKFVFLDVYAVWCGPCKKMAATSFVDERVSAYYNEHFINIKIDGEKGEGPLVMDKYDLHAFPSLLYFSPDGDLVRKVVGGMDPQQMMTRGIEVIDPASTPVYGARKVYFKSEKSREDLKNYLQVMITNDADSLAHYAGVYYQRYKDLDISNPVEFEVFYLMEGDVTKPISAAFLEHPESYDIDKYTTKLGMFIQKSFDKAVIQRDFTGVQLTVHTIYPYLQRTVTDQELPTEEEYMMYLRAKFEGE